ncbi:MAG: DMT family transporter [Candidatus Aenigmatarchaeota archaeon]
MSTNKAYGLMLVAVLLWSPVPIWIREVENFVSLPSITFWRSAFGLLALLPFYLIMVHKQGMMSFSVKRAAWLVILGVSSALAQHLFVLALEKNLIADSSFIQQAHPIWTVIGAHFLLKERSPKKFFFPLILSLSGVGIIAYEGGGFSATILGHGFAFFSGVSISVAALAIRSLHLDKVKTLEITFWGIFLRMIVMFFLSGAHSLVSIGGRELGILGVMGIVSTVTPLYLYAKAMQIVEAQKLSLFLTLMVITFPLTGLLYGEIPSGLTILGGLLVGVAILIMRIMEPPTTEINTT